MDGEWVVPGFRHVRKLGDGASGLVMQAEHLESGIPVAIKYLSPQLVEDEDFLVRFREEARILAQLRDPNLVRFHEYVESRHGAAIVMELVDGVSLGQLIASEGPTGPEAALYVLKGSLLGLAAAHIAGVVHRDYKPGNVLVDSDGNSKLADFGIAIRAGDNVPSAGTPAYMPPEQWGGRPVSPATDVYAATAVFYECLTGHGPYPAQTLPQLALAHRTAVIPLAEVPQPLRPLVEHGMAKDLYDRPQSATAFLSELEATAFAAYGSGWEERGRNTLKERAALLAMLLPLSRPADSAGATAFAASSLGEDYAEGRNEGFDWDDDKPRRGGLMAAAGIAALLLIGGGTAVVYMANSGGSTVAGGKTTLSPSAAPVTPSDTATPADTPTSSATPTPTPTPTSAPTVSKAPPIPVPSVSTTAPWPSTTSPAPKPKPSTTSPKPVPFQITKVSIVVGTPNVDGVGSYTITVTTKGGPAKPITVSASSADVGIIKQPSGGPTSFTGSYGGGRGLCRITISATANPGGVSNSGTWTSTSPSCVG